MKIIVSGTIGRYPVGGMAWIQLHYLLGLMALGHDVYYLEDCGDESWVYDWDRQELTSDLDYPAHYVESCLSRFGLSDRWIYRAGDSTRGMDAGSFVDVCASADLLLIWAVPLARWRREYYLPRRRAYIDADPGFTQVSWLKGDVRLSATIEQSESLFTIAQRIGRNDCAIPTGGRVWHPTVPPVVVAEWPAAGTPPADAPLTCVMHWRGHKDIEHKGITYGQKDREFPKFADLPALVDRRFVLAATGEVPAGLDAKGWTIEPGWVASRTLESYASFIRLSFAEFGVAKHGYVAMRGGWFSDRSVCYLASGRPVVVEDTGLGDWLPLGEGIHAFKSVADAAAAISLVEADYIGQSSAARRIAQDVFGARSVLSSMLERIGV